MQLMNTETNNRQCVIFMKNGRLSITAAGCKRDESKTEQLLTVKLVKYQKNDHISDICKTAGTKITSLARVTPYMGPAKQRILIIAFFASQISDCPLV